MWTEDKVLALIDKMTVQEKVGQLNQLGCSIYGILDDSHYTELIKKGAVGSFLTTMGSININNLQRYNMEQSRLKIPLLFAGDIIHGVKTIFPTPLAESCTWDTFLAYKTAKMAAKEASALGIRQTYAPMVDIARDARWGRIVEGAGEDVLLGKQFAKARVQGFQGDSVVIGQQRIGACAKHFAGYGAPTSGKDYDSVEMSQYTLENFYLPPFYEAVKSGATMLMTAFHTLNGVPCTASSMLLKDYLRDKWQFNGTVVSDYASITELFNHHYAPTQQHCVKLALENGVDIDMADMLYQHHLADMIESGQIEMKYLDQSVKRVLLLKYRLGLFDNPYCDESREKTVLFSKEARELCLEVGKRAMVLLKNENNALPLSAKSRVLVVGALATQKENMLGSWAYYDNLDKVTDIVEGLSKVYNVDYLPVFDLDNLDNSQLEKAVTNANQYDRIFVVAGETIHMAGESGSRADLELPSSFKRTASLINLINNRMTLLLVSGRPLALQSVEHLFDSIVACWNLGMTMGDAVAHNLSAGNFSGKLTTSFPRITGQCPIHYTNYYTGRPYVENERYCTRYVDVKATALYPFGHGLTYSNATIIDSQTAVKDKRIVVKVTVANDSNIACLERVQVYVAPQYSMPVRPIKQLIAHSAVQLPPHSTQTVNITIPIDDLGDILNGKYRQPQGVYTIMTGLSSATTISQQITI